MRGGGGVLAKKGEDEEGVYEKVGGESDVVQKNKTNTAAFTTQRKRLKWSG